MLVPNSLEKSTSPATVGGFPLLSLTQVIDLCRDQIEKFTLEYPQLMHWSKLCVRDLG